ncbi:MAG: deoxyguanosinetriphosphate triphosphohydrolase [Deltaproteobacteria bacterium]|nr:deoxyguanosinetriphosphate triphosphohydrolase [Deltaproteobacteria bacterium]
MTIRLLTEEYELKNLHPRAAKSADAQRAVKEEQCSVRTAFQRDRDRIIHSKAFRRLGRKTQVFLNPDGDHYRNRLTHTLEVSQIARTICVALKLNEDLCEAISLGHDLGHTPFGHSGEGILAKLCSKGFHHSIQSLRVVEVVENNGKGLNLTEDVKNGILKHSKGKGPILTDRQSVLPSTLEGQVVRLADIIAYVNHDLEDGMRAGVIANDELPLKIIKKLGDSHRTRISSLVLDVINSSDIDNGGDISMSDDMHEALSLMRDFLYDSCYMKPQLRTEFEKAQRLLSDLWFYYIENPFLLNRNISEEQAVVDYLAGMTDRYAIRVWKDINVPRSWFSDDTKTI